MTHPPRRRADVSAFVLDLSMGPMVTRLTGKTDNNTSRHALLAQESMQDKGLDDAARLPRSEPAPSINRSTQTDRTKPPRR